MEGEEGTGLVLARASELLSKISDCILDRAAQRRSKDEGVKGRSSSVADRDGGGGGGGRRAEEGEDDEEGEDEEEEASLFDIRDALESLEQQLSSLQMLEQQQRYEREATLAQIDQCRMLLLSKIKEYKGMDLEVIQETLNFAGGNVERDEGLLLPPYSNHVPDVFILDDLYSSSHFASKHRFHRNGLVNKSVHQSNTNVDESRVKQSEPVGGSILKGVKFTLGLVIKSAITFVSVLSILSLAGFEPRLKRRGSQFKLLDVFERSNEAEDRVSNRCPPGKVLVIEDGKSRCIVKERVEIPFDAVGPAPSMSYGLG